VRNNLTQSGPSADWVDANTIFVYSDALLTVPLPG
jgi:hypothetical protein